jgi:ABC-2 type transport system permease protein
MSVLPALIVVGVVVLTGLDSLPVSYADYTNQTQLLVSLFAAAQAPVLFSRDLRHRSIVLYLARPLSAPLFALMRWLSLTVALWLFMAVPTLLLFVGAMLSGLDKSDQTTQLLKAVVLQTLLALLIAGITGLISSISLRRGFAVVGSVMALIVLIGVVTAIQAISAEEDADAVSVAAGLFSPWSLYNGLANAWDAGVETFVPVDGAWVLAYALVALLLVAGCLLGLVARFRKVGSR